MIITIDGFAGSGKSTVARLLAERLGFRLLNTGVMYRAVALVLQDAGIDIYAPVRAVESIQKLLEPMHFEFKSGEKLFISGIDFSQRLLAGECSGEAASKVGTFPEVRDKLQKEQRRLVLGDNFVCEGRDQGRVVFPEAPYKFFLDAQPHVKAARRVTQMQETGLQPDYNEVLLQIQKRDDQDRTRPIDPTQPADDALQIDTSNISAAEVVDMMLKAMGKL